jgi:PAS domain S-box-containing protein
MEKHKISKNLLFTQKHFDLILKLNKTSFVDKNTVEEIYNVITETLVDGLNIDRSGFWRLHGENLICINLYDKGTNKHTSGDSLASRDLPIYFKALTEGIAIVADNVLTNEFTQELKEGYLIPLGITDMLDLPIRENGKIIGVLCCEHRDDPRVWNESDLAFAKSVSDILTLMLEKNKRREVTQQLLENQRKLSLITDNAKDIFMVFEDGKMTFVSPSYSKDVGFSEEEIMNYKPEDIFNSMHQDDVNDVKKIIYESLEQKLTNFKYQFRIKTKSGRYIWREDATSIIYDDSDKKYSKYIVISRDISHIKKAQEKIDKLYSLSKIQNLKLLDFTHIISHNIRSNTSNMTMLLDLIEDTKSDKEKSEYFNLLKDSNKKLSDTIHFLNETITIQLKSKAKKYKLNVKNEVEKTLVSINALLLDANVEIKNEVSKAIEINTIPAYFESIMFNLISNAIKYKAPKRKAIVAISAKKKDDKIVISVKDNGIGIDLKLNKDKVFGMYKTFHGNEDAVGLGLFMTKNHIEALGGKIEVKSEINVGSEFKVTLNE